MRDLIYQPAALRALLPNITSLSRCLIIGEPGSGRTTLANSLAIKLGSLRIERVSCAGPLGPVRRSLFSSNSQGGSERERVLIIEEVCASDLGFQQELSDWLSTVAVVGNVICTADSRIYSLIRSGDFALGLYSLLSSPLLRIPPLRERPEDLIPLAHGFIERCEQPLRSRKHRVQLADDATNTLYQHDWPGNLSELQNVITTAVLRSRYEGRKTIEAGDINIPQLSEASELLWTECQPLREAVREFERSYIRKALSSGSSSGFTMAETCKRLGVGRTTLWRKLGAGSYH